MPSLSPYLPTELPLCRCYPCSERSATRSCAAGHALIVCWSIHLSRCSCLNFANRPTLMKPSFRADPQPYKVNLDVPRYCDATSIVKNLLIVPPENERASVTVNNIPSHTNRVSLTTRPSPHDAPAWPPALDSNCTLSECEPALTSSGQAFRVPSRGSPPVSGLSPASAPSRLLLRRPTPVL